MGSSTGKKKKKRFVLKKRFFIFCLIFLLLVTVVIVAAVKTISSAFSSAPSGEKVEGDKDPAVKADKTSDGDGVQPAVMMEPTDEEDGDSDKDKGKDKDGDDDDAPKSMEVQIRDAVLSNWYIAPLGQTRSAVEETFGVLTRGEKYNGMLYYHSKFADTMYVTYKGKLGDDGLPNENAVCDSVSIVMKKIIGFERFKPTQVWGDFHKDKTGKGWTDQYYSILIKNDVNLIVYCDEEGYVDQETHIIVRKV